MSKVVSWSVVANCHRSFSYYFLFTNKVVFFYSAGVMSVMCEHGLGWVKPLLEKGKKVTQDDFQLKSEQSVLGTSPLRCERARSSKNTSGGLQSHTAGGRPKTVSGENSQYC